MKTGIGHIQFNVQAEHVPYYKDLFGFLGWQTIAEDDGFLGLAGGNGESFWFVGEVKNIRNDYDGPGMKHIGVAADSVAAVDAAGAFLSGKGVELLFGTPCHRPDYADSKVDTYYQIMWETPDRILLEVVYTGSK